MTGTGAMTRRRQLMLVSVAYGAFSVTDGALRMLVLLHFNELGYSPVSLALLFLLYELVGVVTNLVGGWLGGRVGLGLLLRAGLALQVIALTLLSLHDGSWGQWASVGWIMGAQAISGIAKDLTKTSAKSSTKLVAAEGELFRVVAAVTGSKNALKGAGFFVGATLLSSVGFDMALLALAAGLAVILVIVLFSLPAPFGRVPTPAPFTGILSKSREINLLAAARLFLFGARDIWFVVALPVFLADVLDWSFSQAGAFLATWVIGYGIVQSSAPNVLVGRASPHRFATMLIVVLALVAAGLAVTLSVSSRALPMVIGLVLFGVAFALVSSLHSFLIVESSADGDAVAGDVGYYYSANAAGRLVGTLLSGALYLAGGFSGALWGATGFLLIAALLSARLDRHVKSRQELGSHPQPGHDAEVSMRPTPPSSR